MSGNQKFIFDALTRRQVFLEELKEDRYVNHVDPIMRAIAKAVRARFAMLSEAEFETMTRKQFEAWLKQLENDLERTFIPFEEAESDFTDEFIKADSEVQRQIYEVGLGKNIRKVATAAATKAAIIPALGVQGSQVTKKYIDDVISHIKTEAIRGYADKEKASTVKDWIVGTKANRYSDGLLMRAKRWYRANVTSHIQSIAMVGASEYYKVLRDQGDFSDHYIWKSVLDSRTSDICRSRSNNIYEVGKGPLPPAHPNCRSNTIPLIVGIQAETAKNYPSNWISWISDQPEPVLEKILGIDYTAKLQDQRAIAKFNPLGTVDIKQYTDATGTMTFAAGIRKP